MSACLSREMDLTVFILMARCFQFSRCWVFISFIVGPHLNAAAMSVNYARQHSSQSIWYVEIYRCVYFPWPFVAMVNNSQSFILFLFLCLVPFCWTVGSDAFRPYIDIDSLSLISKSLNQKYCICKSNGICFRTLSPRQWICSVRLTINRNGRIRSTGAAANDDNPNRPSASSSCCCCCFCCVYGWRFSYELLYWLSEW